MTSVTELLVKMFSSPSGMKHTHTHWNFMAIQLCSCVSTYVYLCGQRPALGIFFSDCPSCVLRQGLLLNKELNNSARPVGEWAPESAYLHLPELGLCVCTTVPIFFILYSGVWAYVCILAQRTPSRLSHAHSSAAQLSEVIFYTQPSLFPATPRVFLLRVSPSSQTQSCFPACMADRTVASVILELLRPCHSLTRAPFLTVPLFSNDIYKSLGNSASSAQILNLRPQIKYVQGPSRCPR